MSMLYFINRLKDAKSRYIEFRDKNALTACLDLTAMMKNRIQTTGENSDNNKFEDYTSIYADERAKDGYQNNYVDFTRTGKMFASVSPLVVSSDSDGTTVEIKARSESDQVKINGAFKKRGNILLNTDTEHKSAMQGYEKRLYNFLSDFMT